MTRIDTLVTPELEAQKGVWTDEQASYPVSASDIRRWAIAVYWGETPPRIYWDEEYAKSTRWGGIIAPEDFNPFAWAVPMTEPSPAGAVPGQEAKKGENILNGGMTEKLGAKIRPGDVITTRSRLMHWEERQGRNGLTLYTYVETEWTNQNGEIVKTRVKTTIRY
ncbi:MaoC family dehydratase N-terminal domain-containing protein [Frankia sp. CNm7]|uniref:MaoC family dehydratase N-terminal domain-containing protein n=1 Tax=Frankia nepalensis TaxID=1836974 RepID=A0A937URK9_9ACTN|nr:MaoC family dehydratase N-terminal domain-containing protein [Frankia nepalensis]MBL7499747.1 MaoC family dehydratase N-terminal domain-containing protein [Frankia nepalensis]MBL7512232.1 MaoC family dehydratase N-terminal domain-containing protein [Frankia nepalensis]MBL7523943.1 MaoC family dehydratase N-terminal domain-containing protein [Frankia nepalensis]MBL7632969.1 MaoC family dehydratase N-terminal domain-containing protein [Frankia nepalensis]